VCWRIGIMLGYGVTFTAITQPRELREAILYFLKPVPFLKARRIGLMVSLTLHFFAILLDEVEEVRLALRARLGDRVRNPLRRATFIALPVVRRGFLRVDDVTLAIAARGFRDDIPYQSRKLPLSQLIPVSLFTVFVAL